MPDAATDNANHASLDLEKQQNQPNDDGQLNNACTCAAPRQSAFKSLGILDTFLAVWIFLAMAVGIILGNFVPNTGRALQRGTFVGVSIPIGEYLQRDKRSFPKSITFFFANPSPKAIGLLIMMYPILCKVRFESLHRVFQTREIWIQIAFSIFVNWIIAPFLMVRHFSSAPDVALVLIFVSLTQKRWV